ncbi:MAG: HAD family hydrolase [Sphaerochaetaceae bacterium]|nr:HAD family hydrolase [Sphaerochaetaceae bacterium]
MALVFLDLDGTTLDGGKIAPGVLDAIELLRKNKHIVAIATGRSPVLINGNDKIFNVDYLVLSNGGYVTHNGEVIYSNLIPKETVKELMDLADELEFDMGLEYYDRYVAYRKKTAIVDYFSEAFNIEKPIEDHSFRPDEDVFGMIVYRDDHIELLKKRFPNLQFSRSIEKGYDINNKGDLKADGVRALVKYLNYPKSEVYAIGDGTNDITMLRTVEHGIAMGNAYDSVKAEAEYVTTNVDDYGVYNALKHYNLI